MIERVREAYPSEQAQFNDPSAYKEQDKELRIKGKGKGRELLTRYNGETVEGEPPCIPQDPRKAPGFRRKPHRSEFHPAKYEVRVL